MFLCGWRVWWWDCVVHCLIVILFVLIILLRLTFSSFRFTHHYNTLSLAMLFIIRYSMWAQRILFPVLPDSTDQPTGKVNSSSLSLSLSPHSFTHSLSLLVFFLFIACPDLVFNFVLISFEFMPSRAITNNCEPALHLHAYWRNNAPLCTELWHHSIGLCRVVVVVWCDSTLGCQLTLRLFTEHKQPIMLFIHCSNCLSWQISQLCNFTLLGLCAVVQNSFFGH